MNSFQIWKEEAAKSLTKVAKIDIHKQFCRLALDIIGETAFGYKFDTVVSGENKVSLAVETLLTGKISVMSRLLRRIIPFYDKFLDRFSTELRDAQQITNAAVNEVSRVMVLMVPLFRDPVLPFLVSQCISFCMKMILAKQSQ